MAVKRGAGSDNAKDEKPWALEVRELEPEEEELMKELEKSERAYFYLMAVVLIC
jgi:hypothetical protein